MSESTPIPVAIMPATHTPETLAPHVDAALRGLEESDHPADVLVVLRVAEEPVYDAATGQQIDGYAHAHHVHARVTVGPDGTRRAELLGHVTDGVAR